MAKRPNKDKYGSAYDPRNVGKVQQPQAEPNQYQTRGCGDPTCPQCNPETASMASSRGFSPDRYVNIIPPGGIFSGLLDGPTGERIREAMERSLGGIEYSFITTVDPSATANPTPKGPPAAYKAAREAVEEYIIDARAATFDDIVGNEEALGLLKDAISAPVTHKELYEAYGMKMPKGALLSGPPGCGKTMFARAAATEMERLYAPASGAKFEFLSLAGPALQTMYVGETEKRITALFTFAREYKAYHGHPLLIFIDEADVILPDRTGRVRRVAPWEESQVATFLAEMDGMQESGAFLLLATNRPEAIDSAVLRDGRCDFKITVKMPTKEAVNKILEKNFVGVFLGPSSATTTTELVFAALESLYDPHRVIMEAHAFRLRLTEEHGIEVAEDHVKPFLLEHIISGAMAASIPGRATRHAFARDKHTPGTITGVTSNDVVAAVNDVFNENKTLEHAYAIALGDREPARGAGGPEVPDLRHWPCLPRRRTSSDLRGHLSAA